MLAPSFLDDRLGRFFWRHCIPEPNSGCWLWVGTTQKDGYGSFCALNVHSTLAHRHAYIALVGPVPPGLQLDHLCRTRCCVNPSHLEPVTQAENLRRGLIGDLKTHCKNGHELAGENLRIEKNWLGNPSRRCKACNRTAARRYAAKKQAVAL